MSRQGKARQGKATESAIIYSKIKWKNKFVTRVQNVEIKRVYSNVILIELN
jgi:hypothetical protein